jgi:hypothetical protein
MRRVFRRILVVGVGCSLLLPIALLVVIGLGFLLASVGDEVGGAVCARAALVLGVVWIVAVVATAVASGVAALDGGMMPGGRPRPRHRRRPPLERALSDHGRGDVRVE